MTQKNNSYVIGVDGGATKTVAALADMKGRVLKIGKPDSSNPRNVGIKNATGHGFRIFYPSQLPVKPGHAF